MQDTPQVLVIIVAISGFLHQTKATTCSAEGSPFTYYQTSGSVQSPGFPDYYNANEKCAWHLNPPKGTSPGLIVIDIELEINVGDPSNGVGCRNSKAFALIGSVKGCDKEGPICLAFMLATNNDFRCHNIVGRYFSHCHSLLSQTWPLDVAFHTDEAKTMKGVGLNYTFVDCTDDYAPPSPDDESEESHNETTAEPSVQTSSINPSKGTLESEEPLLTRNPKLSAAPNTLKIEKGDGKPPKQPNTNTALIAVFAALCVLLIVLVILFIFRRRIKNFAGRRKGSVKSSISSVTNNNTIEYADGCVLPFSKGKACGQPLSQNPPSYLASTQQSTTNDQVPSVSCTIPSDNTNNCINFHCDRLDEVRSATGLNGLDSPVYSTLEE